MGRACSTTAIAILSAFARVHAADTFEVASVKPSPPIPANGGVYFGPARGGPGTPDPGQITWTYARFIDLLTTAYDVQIYQINGPAWMASERYDIQVKLAPGTTQNQVRLMWKNLLAERFGLMLHHESKEFQVEELVAAKAGHKLKESDDDPAFALTGEPPKLKDGALLTPGLVSRIMPGANGLNVQTVARAQPLSKLTGMLTNVVGRPVLNKTGLAGTYDFTLDFTAPAPPRQPRADAPEHPAESGPEISAAIEQQLGLKLVAAKARLDTLIIDKIEKTPTAN
jgi:uncharacterized protein (TIGR03435 family)